MNTKLSTDQKNFIENNYGAIFSFMRKYHIDDEDMQQDIIVDMMKYIGHYEETKGAPTTFLYKCLEFARWHILRHDSAKSRTNDNGEVRLDAPLPFDSPYGIPLLYGDIIASTENTYEKFVSELFSYLKRTTLKDRDIDMYKLWLIDNAPLRIISEKYNISYQAVHQHIMKVNKKAQNFCKFEYDRGA